MINKGAVTVEVHTQIKNALSSIERIRYIRIHPSIYTTLIIFVLNITVINQIYPSDEDRRIISSQIFRNGTLRIIKFTGSHKIQKLVHTYIQKCIRSRKSVQIKYIHRRYTCLWHVCLPMNKVLEEILETGCNWPIWF